MQNSKVHWCDDTNNLWEGCTSIHDGCTNCFAEALNHRWKKNNWGNDAPRREVKKVWDDFKKSHALAIKENRYRRVFVGSMFDVGEKPMPLVSTKGEPLGTTQALRERYANEVVPATPWLLHLLLSKRPGNYNKFFPESWKENPPHNVMFGASISDQLTAKTLIPRLLNVKGKRFLSIEPLLGPINLATLYKGQNRPLEGVDWVIVGGESGPHARIMELEWLEELVDDCRHFGVPVFVKQLGSAQAKRLQLKDYKGGDPSEWWPLLKQYCVREFNDWVPEIVPA